VSLSHRNVFATCAAAAIGAVMLGAAGPSAVAASGYPDPTLDLPRKTSPYPGVGPHRPFVQEILIGGVTPLKDGAIINRTEHGFLYRAGQQDNNVTISEVGGRLNFADTATTAWKWLPRVCKPLDVSKGIAASCRVADKFTLDEPMLVEVWPRLGNDTLDASALPELFDVAFLGDRGDDVAYFGAGDDFFNGAQDEDRAYGGPGGDWLRMGLNDDYIDGGADGDYLVGVDGNDTVRGGAGDDRLFGINGNDVLDAGSGNDSVSCGNGTDTANVKSTDRTSSCETLNRL
jgi:Ca2+-binding RTX toxin-like protein